LCVELLSYTVKDIKKLSTLSTKFLQNSPRIYLLPTSYIILTIKENVSIVFGVSMTNNTNWIDFNFLTHQHLFIMKTNPPSLHIKCFTLWEMRNGNDSIRNFVHMPSYEELSPLSNFMIMMILTFHHIYLIILIDSLYN
jgi:hypothetical protein